MGGQDCNRAATAAATGYNHRWAFPRDEKGTSRCITPLMLPDAISVASPPLSTPSNLTGGGGANFGCYHPGSLHGAWSRLRHQTTSNVEVTRTKFHCGRWRYRRPHCEPLTQIAALFDCTVLCCTGKVASAQHKGIG